MKDRLLLRCGLRHHLHKPLRSGLAVLGIALGVALLVGIQSALGSATAAFEAAATTLAGKTTHAVRGGPDGVPTAVLAVLARDRAVRAAAPVTEGRAVFTGGPRWGVRYFGCDLLAEAGVGRPFGAVANTGAGHGGAAVPGDGPLPLAALLTEPGAFAATASTRARLRPAADGTTRLLIGGQPWQARCVSTIDQAAGQGVGLDDVIVVDIATAQEWSGRLQRVDRIDLVLDPRTVDAAVARLEQQLGPSLRIEPTPGHAGFAELTAAFRTNLQALGLMALLVSAFLVHAAMRGAVAGRQVEFALLRALGAPSLRLGAVVVREAIVLGLCGSALGCGLGIAAAHALVGPLVRTLNDHYASFALHGVATDPWLLVAALLLGTLVAVAAALAPAREAAHAPPRAVFVSSRLPHVAHGTPLWTLLPLAVAGTLLLLLAGQRVVLAHAGLLLMMLAVAAVAPRAVEGALLACARTLTSAGPWVTYLMRSAAQSRSRTGSAVAALVLAVAITTGLGMMIQSFRTSVAIWLDQALPADVYVGVLGRNAEREGRVLEAVTTAAILQVPGIAGVSTYRRFQLDVAHGQGPPRAIDTLVLRPSPRVLARLPLLFDAASARERFARGEGALVSEPLAFQMGLQVGDELVVATDAGPRTVSIVGVVRDYRSSRGELTLPADWYGPTPVSSLGLEAGAGLGPEDLEARVRGCALDLAQSVDIDSQAAIKHASLTVFDRTFAITVALRLLCIGIAVLGIYGAFAALQHERMAEIGVLRSLGAGPRHVAMLVLGQTTLLGFWAGVLALPVGYGIGLVLVHSINRGSFGWTLLEVALPPRVAVEAMVLAVAAAFVAGIEPAVRMVRMAPATALREG